MSAHSRASALRPCLLAAIALCVPLQGVLAQARLPRAPTPPAPSAPADATPDNARLAFEALPDAERRAVQEALVWTGQFVGVVAGTFGRRTFDAIVAYQRAAGAAPSGILDDRARASLLAAGRQAQAAAGFVLRRDAATGVALGVPTKLLPREGAVPGGSRWQSADGRITLETRAYAPDETDLQAVFDRVSVATPQRKVTYKLKRPDFLVVSGETPTGRFYIRYAATTAGVRGFTISYDKAVTDLDRVVIAISNSFDPEPGRAVAAVPVAPSAPAAGAPPASGSKTVATAGTALMLAPGRVVTSARALADCAAPRMGGAPARTVASDTPSGLVLLQTDDTKTLPSLSSGPEPKPGDPLVVFAMEAGRATVVSGEAISGARIVAPLQPGAAGAPVLDRAGHLVGLIAAYPSAPATVAGVVPPMPFAMTRIAALTALLERAGQPLKSDAATDARSTGEIAAMVAPALRVVTCEAPTVSAAPAR